MSARTKILTTVAFASAAVIAAFVAGGASTVIEVRSRKALQLAMETYGHSWVEVQTDGLQAILLGTAPSEAERFRAITRAGTVVEFEPNRRQYRCREHADRRAAGIFA
ncbi:hypothetical protein [Paenirhodobacter sp.]|uniref:hypothetical protein n=1 Tax=Paenirhodobacter sp. TaxID=1965326 RepID=UPI003B40C5D7